LARRSEASVEEACATNKGRVWVAELGAGAASFVAIELDRPDRSTGEISILAVDPYHQGGGIGTTLSEFALGRLRDAGMTVAIVETGAAPGTPLRPPRARRPAAPTADSQVLQEPVATKSRDVSRAS
jgi:GNAT superfamily N-acetyltransferase